jgi:hypothetical protein
VYFFSLVSTFFHFPAFLTVPLPVIIGRRQFFSISDSEEQNFLRARFACRPPFPIRLENVSLAPHQDVVAALIFSSVATHRPCIAWNAAVLASSREEQTAGTTVEDFSMTVTIRYCRKLSPNTDSPRARAAGMEK